MKIHAVAARLLFFFSFFFFKDFLPRQTLCLEQRSVGLLEVKLIFQHIGYKIVMRIGDEL